MIAASTKFIACGSMVLPVLSVFRFLRSTSAKTETQKKIKHRSAEGYIADCVILLFRAMTLYHDLRSAPNMLHYVQLIAK